MGTGFLDALGLKAPARGLPEAEADDAGAPPIDSSIEGAPNRDRIPKAAPAETKPLPADAPRKVDLKLRADYLEDADITKALKALPTDPPKRAEALADLILKVSDGARRDPLVRALRDLLVKIPQPFMTEAELKKKIDDGITSLVEKGIKEGVMAILKAVVGKEPTKTDPNAPPRYGPPGKEVKVPGEVIIKTPELPLPWDKPKPVRRNSFEFRGLKPSYKVSKYFDFTVRTADWFEPYGKLGAGRVIIGPKAGGTSGEKIRDKRIETKGDVAMSLAAPDEPGDYIMYIWLGPSAESHPVEAIKVIP